MFLELASKRREYDGKWETMAKIIEEDPDDPYGWESGATQIRPLNEKWITIDVTDERPDLNKWKNKLS